MSAADPSEPSPEQARFDELRRRMHEQGGEAQEFAELATDLLQRVRAEARAEAFAEAVEAARRPAGNRLMSHEVRQRIIVERIRRTRSIPLPNAQV